jgi:hypothetical protein
VEYRAVITLAAEDMQKAELYGTAVIKDNAQLIYVRAVHERNWEQASEDLSGRTGGPKWPRKLSSGFVSV